MVLSTQLRTNTQHVAILQCYVCECACVSVCVYVCVERSVGKPIYMHVHVHVHTYKQAEVSLI